MERVALELKEVSIEAVEILGMIWQPSEKGETPLKRKAFQKGYSPDQMGPEEESSSKQIRGPIRPHLASNPFMLRHAWSRIREKEPEDSVLLDRAPTNHRLGVQAFQPIHSSIPSGGRTCHLFTSISS